MGEIIKLISEHLSVGLTTILGVYLPGMASIYLYNNNMFYHLDIVKLSIIALLIGTPSFLVAFVLMTITIFLYMKIRSIKIDKSYVHLVLYWSVMLNISIFLCFYCSKKTDQVDSNDLFIMMFYTLLMCFIYFIVFIFYGFFRGIKTILCRRWVRYNLIKTLRLK